ncbi:hypothetical protein GOP47_0012448 [Adiantum capillus-veneris]|uniref:Uncharacterized protein n=1 Tax=Adiantum capillus-veneris TaxID=13818 RepID=A0A9D4URS4_ADICA|nr:hypothetical protein GOP47_0012448 [Adiantum capillus-veneris]
MEEEKNKCSYQRVLQSFHRNCRREFLPVSGCRFHVKRLLRDLYHGHKYHGRFYVSRLDGWTTFVMGQVNILTVVLNVEHLEEDLKASEYLQGCVITSVTLLIRELLVLHS